MFGGKSRVCRSQYCFDGNIFVVETVHQIAVPDGVRGACLFEPVGKQFQRFLIVMRIVDRCKRSGIFSCAGSFKRKHLAINRLALLERVRALIFKRAGKSSIIISRIGF